MPLRTRVLVAVGCGLAVVLGGCGGRDAAEDQGAPSGMSSAGPSAVWPLGSSELASTGWRLVGAPRGQESVSSAWSNGANAMVADGEGNVWVRSGWQVTRVHGTSGESRSWDAGDDAVFGSVGLTLAPAASRGVWLLDGGRIRLFDGDRFAVDLQVPAEILDVTDAEGRIRGTVEDVVERGSELWLSVHAERITEISGEEMGGRVVRWADGQWSQMSTLADGASGDLALDSEGHVWAGGRIASPAGYDQGVRRWDGSDWVLPGADSSEAPTSPFPPVGTVAADHAGGMWFLAWGDDGRLYHFDGTAWRSWRMPEGNMALAVAGDGAAWLTRSDPVGGVTRVSADGGADAVGGGLSEASGDVEVTGGDLVLVTDRDGVLRLSGDGFTRIWQEPVAAFLGWVAAVSQEEVWAWDAWGGEQFHYDGEWGGMGLAAECAPVLANDGALWVPTSTGLVRRSADRGSVVAAGVDGCTGMLAGADGSVLLPLESEVARVAPDGTRTAIPWPGDTVNECLKAAGADGTVWVSAETDPGESGCDDPRELVRWDGRRWTPVEAPPIGSLGRMVVTDDGAAWVSSGYPGDFLGRYDNGPWESYDVGRLNPGALAPGPGGRVCGMEQADPDSSHGDAIVCFDATGEVARIDIGGMGVSAFSVALDGTVWALGGQVAQVDAKLPTR